MRFHSRLIVPSIVSLIALQLVVPQLQRAARAEESELVLKTAGEEAKPETKDGKPEAAKEPVKSDSGGAKKDEDSAAKSQAKPAEASAEKPKPKYPPFAELLKDAQKLEGLINFYRKDDQL